jgi:hypothetical protein
MSQVPESQFCYIDVSRAVLLEFVLIKQTRQFSVEIETAIF